MIISREDAIDAIDCIFDRCAEIETYYTTVWGFLKQLPSAQSKHGRWLNDGKPVKMINGIPQDTCWCSECGEWLTASDEYPVYGNYCPFCGAKMEGESNDR